MDIALNVQYGRDDQLIFAQQLGVEQVVMTVENYGEEVLAMAKNRVEKSALKLAGLEGLVLADVEAASAVVRAAGAVGIGLVSVGQTAVDAREPVGRGYGWAALRPSSQCECCGIGFDGGQRSGGAIGVGGRCARGECRLGLGGVGRDRSGGHYQWLWRPAVDGAGWQCLGGPVRAGLPPGMVGDTEWGHKGRAYDLGYLKAVLQAIASL